MLTKERISAWLEDASVLDVEGRAMLASLALLGLERDTRAEDAYGDLAIRCVCGRHVVDNDVTPEEQVRRFFAWLDDEPVSRADHSDRVIAKLRDMSPDEVRKTFVDAGIYDQDGNLTEPYRG